MPHVERNAERNAERNTERNQNREKTHGLRAFHSRRVVTPAGLRPAALLVRDERIESVTDLDRIPSGIEVHDFGESAILPGLVDSHVHVNDPGPADFEGFETATRAAAAGVYTMLVDMPLNCLPATTTVAALEAKRQAAQGRCWVGWGAWGGLGRDHQAGVEMADIQGLAPAGVLGFKCFLIHPGLDGFTMVTEPELRAALPQLARTGLPLLVHAELPGPVGMFGLRNPIRIKFPISRAYHDSLFRWRIAPTGMLFIPCCNGDSHRPDEYASPEDIARGTLVLAPALAALAQ